MKDNLDNLSNKINSKFQEISEPLRILKILCRSKKINKKNSLAFSEEVKKLFIYTLTFM